MSSDPILGFPLIDPNQTGKTLTLNTAIDAVAQSMAGTLTIAANSNPTPYTIPYSATPDEPAGTKTALRFFYMNVTGALSGAWTAYMPAGPMAHFWVTNSTTGGYTITIKVSGQTGVAVAPGETRHCYLNGTDVVSLVDTGPITFTVSPTVPTLPFYDNSTKVANSAFTQAAIQASMAYAPLVGIVSGTYSLSSLGTLGTVTYTVSGGVINAISSIPVAGSNYKVGDLLGVAAGNNDAVLIVLTLSGSGVASLGIAYGGTGYAAGTANLLSGSGTISDNFTFSFSGVLTGNVTFLLAFGTYTTQGQQYIFFNNTTGAHTFTVKQADVTNTATGTGVAIPQGTSNSLGVFITNDGETDVWAGSSFVANTVFNSVTFTGNTSGVADFIMTPTWTNIGGNTSALSIAPSFVQTTGGGTAFVAGARNSSLNVGAANTKNWTANPGFLDINSNPAITNGASGTITGMSAISCSVSNLSASATLTNAIALTINPAVATGTITNNIGANINPGTAGGTTNVDLLIGTATIPTGNFSIYNANTALSQFAGPIKLTGATAGTTDFTINPTFTGLASSTITADISPITNVTAAGTANTAQGLQISPSIGATNSQNWTAAVGLRSLNIAPSITSGATGTITGMAGLVIGLANNAAGATLTNAYGIKINATTATGTITNNVGASIAPGTGGGTSNTDLLLGTATPVAGNWALYSANAAASLLTGSLQINGAFPLYLPFNNAVGGVIGSGVTAYFGPVGWYAFSSSQGWVQPWDGHVVKVLVYFDNTPGAGQTYTVTYYENGAPTALTGICTNGNFSVVLTGSIAATAGDSNNVQVVLSAAATPTNVRGYMIVQP